MNFEEFVNFEIERNHELAMSDDFRIAMMGRLSKELMPVIRRAIVEEIERFPESDEGFVNHCTTLHSVFSYIFGSVLIELVENSLSIDDRNEIPEHIEEIAAQIVSASKYILENGEVIHARKRD